MSDFLLGFVLGALLFCATQLCAINGKLDSLDERLYSIQLKCTRIGNGMPSNITDAEEESDDEEESTDDD